MGTGNSIAKMRLEIEVNKSKVRSDVRDVKRDVQRELKDIARDASSSVTGAVDMGARASARTFAGNVRGRAEDLRRRELRRRERAEIDREARAELAREGFTLPPPKGSRAGQGQGGFFGVSNRVLAQAAIASFSIQKAASVGEIQQQFRTRQHFLRQEFGNLTDQPDALAGVAARGELSNLQRKDELRRLILPEWLDIMSGLRDASNRTIEAKEREIQVTEGAAGALSGLRVRAAAVRGGRAGAPLDVLATQQREERLSMERELAKSPNSAAAWARRKALGQTHAEENLFLQRSESASIDTLKDQGFFSRLQGAESGLALRGDMFGAFAVKFHREREQIASPFREAMATADPTRKKILESNLQSALSAHNTGAQLELRNMLSNAFAGTGAGIDALGLGEATRNQLQSTTTSSEQLLGEAVRLLQVIASKDLVPPRGN